MPVFHDSTIALADKPSSCGKAPFAKGKQVYQPERRLAAGRNPMPSDDAKSDRGYSGLMQESTAGKLVREFVGRAVLIAPSSKFAFRGRLIARHYARYAIESLRTARVINLSPVRSRCGTHESGDYTPSTRVALIEGSFYTVGDPDREIRDHEADHARGERKLEAGAVGDGVGQQTIIKDLCHLDASSAIQILIRWVRINAANQWQGKSPKP